MSSIFVDTAAWIALLNQDDDLHLQAQRIMQQLQQKKMRLITSEFIILELADALSYAGFRQRTVRFINSLRQIKLVDVIAIDQSLLNVAWELYGQRLDKSWGLTDCTSFVVMQQQGISIAFTSDKHFEQAGFTRLMTT